MGNEPATLNWPPIMKCLIEGIEHKARMGSPACTTSVIDRAQLMMGIVATGGGIFCHKKPPGPNIVLKRILPTIFQPTHATPLCRAVCVHCKARRSEVGSRLTTIRGKMT